MSQPLLLAAKPIPPNRRNSWLILHEEDIICVFQSSEQVSRSLRELKLSAPLRKDQVHVLTRFGCVAVTNYKALYNIRTALDGKGFVAIGRTCIVNSQYLRELVFRGGTIKVRLKTNRLQRTLTVSRRYKRQLLGSLGLTAFDLRLGSFYLPANSFTFFMIASLLISSYASSSSGLAL